jgi:four helix bundle protein
LRLPKFEQFEEGGQIRRSSKSVASQIVEGHALRMYKPEYLHYLNRSYASAEETIEHGRLLVETGSADRDRSDWLEVLAEYDELTRSLFRYKEAVREHHEPTYGGDARE